MSRTHHAGQRFQIDNYVRVLHLRKKGHVRIPHYVRGKRGKIVQYCGSYLNPEELAIGKSGGCAIDLYRVSFTQRLLWPRDNLPEQDTLVIEIYDHWLEPDYRVEAK